MKSQVLISAISLALTLRGYASFPINKKQPNEILVELSQAIKSINTHYACLISKKELQLATINKGLFTTNDLWIKVDLLIKKEKIQEDIKFLRTENLNEVSKIRYLKGLQIIKILYEKVLSLDHHFASVRTFGEISKISNPNQYPEYEKLRELLANKKDKRNAFELTSLLGTNTVASVIQTLTGLLSSSIAKEEKDRELAKVDCIIDFTLRMQNDLNTIYYETAFLQNSNDKIREEIELLFREYTKPIGYTASLENCRANDNWEEIIQKMQDYLIKMKTSSGATQQRMKVNLDFPIERLLQFIAQYNYFIDQGGKFYQKFSIILNSYENQKQCDSKLALEYKKLKSDISIAIEKFNVAYKPVEINGTKMKEILYGLNEFEKTE